MYWKSQVVFQKEASQPPELRIANGVKSASKAHSGGSGSDADGKYETVFVLSEKSSHLFPGRHAPLVRKTWITRMRHQAQPAFTIYVFLEPPPPSY